MTWYNRVVWQEGMFLRAQHFQQQDRWMMSQLRYCISALRPFGWGFTDVTVSRELLAAGRFALTSAAGLFGDGTPFSVPVEAVASRPIAGAGTARDVLVHIGVRLQQPGAMEVSDSGRGRALRAGTFEAYDTHSASTEPAQLQIGRLRLRYLLDTDDREGYVCLALARVAEVTSDSRVVLDERWIPPALVCSAGGAAGRGWWPSCPAC